MVVLALATGLAANAQDQPVEHKQQTRQNQRMFYQRVFRNDQETMLEDPAITNQLSDEQILPDSNEQNVESRVLTLNDLQQPRFVPAPVGSEGMEFVPGKGYVAGRTEQATEPGMSVLAPTLGFQVTGGLTGAENSPNAEPFPTEVNAGESGPDFVQSRAVVDPYAQPPGPLLSLQPFQVGMSATGISSALERRPTVVLPAPQPSPWQDELTEPSNELTELSNRSNTSEPSAKIARSRRSGPEWGTRTTCKFRGNLATIHDPVQLEKLKREGCLAGQAWRRSRRPEQGRY